MADLSKISATVGLWSLGDFKPDMPTVRGATALIHRLCVRLSTPRGRFPFWPDFGTDLAQFLLSKTTPQQIASDAQAECLKDEQVSQANVAVTVSDRGRKINLSIRIVTSTGPWAFTLDVTDARLTLISSQAA